jgi:hypothetical protein
VYTQQKEEFTGSAAIDDATAIEERKPKKRLMVNYDPTTDVRGSGRASLAQLPVLYNIRLKWNSLRFYDDECSRGDN